VSAVVQAAEGAAVEDKWRRRVHMFDRVEFEQHDGVVTGLQLAVDAGVEPGRPVHQGDGAEVAEPHLQAVEAALGRPGRTTRGRADA
jgi:hypothetical protein